MELIDHLSEKQWQSTDDPVLQAGFQPYTIVRNKPLGGGKFQYAVKRITESDEGTDMVMLTLAGAGGKRDPLQNVRNCSFKVDGEVVVGVDIDGDCVIRKS